MTDNTTRKAVRPLLDLRAALQGYRPAAADSAALDGINKKVAIAAVCYSKLGCQDAVTRDDREEVLDILALFDDIIAHHEDETFPGGPFHGDHWNRRNLARAHYFAMMRNDFSMAVTGLRGAGELRSAGVGRRILKEAGRCVALLVRTEEKGEKPSPDTIQWAEECVSAIKGYSWDGCWEERAMSALRRLRVYVPAVHALSYIGDDWPVFMKHIQNLGDTPEDWRK